MKKCIMVVVVLLYSFIGVNMVFADTWTQKANLGGVERVDAVGFSIGTKGYIGTGTDLILYKNFKDFWEYDPTTDIWTQRADFAGKARRLAVGFSIGNKGYIGTGDANDGNGPVSVDPSCTKDFWEYDSVTNTWTRKADFGGIWRNSATGFSIGNKGYIGTGSAWWGDENGGHEGYKVKDFWEYDPATDTWTRKADFAGDARSLATGFSIGNKGYIGMGANGNSIFNDFWEYDPATDTWTRKADFAGDARTSATGFSIGNKGYIGTGVSIITTDPVTFTLLKDFWEYDSATDIWTKKTDFGGLARLGAVGFSIGNKGYIGTGVSIITTDPVTFTLLKDFWEYCPDCSSNTPPDCSQAYASPNSLWPPNHKYQSISIKGVTDPDGDPITIVVNSIRQDEPVNGLGDGDTSPDATINPLKVRAERSGTGNGRVYQIGFAAQDGKGGTCNGTVNVCVPHDQGQGKVCVDDGPQYDSTKP